MENIFRNDNYCFHGIGYNLEALASIFCHGIEPATARYQTLALAKRQASARKTNGISVVISPSAYCLSPKHLNFLKSRIAFSESVLKGVSFLIEGANSLPADSLYIDERIVKENIALSKIRGIIIPMEKVDARICDINYIDTSLLAMYNNDATRVLDFAEIVCDAKIDRSNIDMLHAEIDKLNTINKCGVARPPIFKKLYSEVSALVEQAFEIKLGKGVKFVDVVDYFNVENLPIYSTHGKDYDYFQTRDNQVMVETM